MYNVKVVTVNTFGEMLKYIIIYDYYYILLSGTKFVQKGTVSQHNYFWELRYQLHIQNVVFIYTVQLK